MKSFCLVPTDICDKSKCELGRFLFNTDCKQINLTSMFIIRRNSATTMNELYGEEYDTARYSVRDWEAGLEKNLGRLTITKNKCAQIIKDKVCAESLYYFRMLDASSGRFPKPSRSVMPNTEPTLTIQN